MKPGEDNYELKVKFLEYYRQLPVQKLAAAHIGRSEDTITDWKKTDSDFSDQIDEAKSEWALRNVKGVRSKEWLLERVLHEHFADKKKLDLTTNGKDFVPVDDPRVLKTLLITAATASDDDPGDDSTPPAAT
jgi:hypothetical protein